MILKRTSLLDAVVSLKKIPVILNFQCHTLSLISEFRKCELKNTLVIMLNFSSYIPYRTLLAAIKSFIKKAVIILAKNLCLE